MALSVWRAKREVPTFCANHSVPHPEKPLSEKTARINQLQARKCGHFQFVCMTLMMIADYDRWKLPSAEYHLFWSVKQ